METQSSNPAPTPSAQKASEWSSTKVYALGAICLVLGMVVGALFRGPAQPAAAVATTSTGMGQPMSAPALPSQMPPQMGGGAPASAPLTDPVFEKVKSDPNNFALLSEAGIAAMKAGNPKVAVDYYQRALKVKDDPLVRTNLGNACFRAGDPDQALTEFAMVLKANPKDPNALYNTGVVKLMGKNDTKGAIASWEAFLKYNPDHPHKAQVEEMLKRVKNMKPAA
jgi:tetratricopeptide (TPR) repeat protein